MKIDLTEARVQVSASPTTYYTVCFVIFTISSGLSARLRVAVTRDFALKITEEPVPCMYFNRKGASLWLLAPIESFDLIISRSKSYRPTVERIRQKPINGRKKNFINFSFRHIFLFYIISSIKKYVRIINLDC